MKKPIFFLFILLFSCFVSCNRLEDEVYNDQYNADDDTSLAKVIVKGVMVVGILDYAPPCAFIDSSGQAVGFDVDILKEVATRLDIEVEFKVIDWGKKDEMLKAGEIDCIASSFTFSKDRQLSHSLTVPTLYNAQVVVVRKNSDIKYIGDLEQKRVGYLKSSNIADFFEENTDLHEDFKAITPYPSFRLALDDLKLHGVDAVLMDLLIINYIMEKSPNDYRILDDALTSEKYVYAFREKDKLLRNSVQKVMLELEYEGRVLELSKKWFGGDLYLFGR